MRPVDRPLREARRPRRRFGATGKQRSHFRLLNSFLDRVLRRLLDQKTIRDDWNEEQGEVSHAAVGQQTMRQRSFRTSPAERCLSPLQFAALR